jgi:hypothetical protein
MTSLLGQDFGNKQITTSLVYSSVSLIKFFLLTYRSILPIWMGYLTVKDI